jgi:spore germination protein KC
MTGRRLLAALLAAVLLLTGCWNRREVNEIAIVTAVAIDLESDQQLRVTILVLDPARGGGGGEGGSPSKAGTFRVTATGQTVLDALRNINQVISRRPEWKHNNAIILSEEVARRGVSQVLDFFVRNYESRLDQWVLVTHGKAADVLVPRFRLEENQGAGIRKLNLSAARTTAKVVPVRLREFMVALAGPPAAPLTAILDRETRAGDPAAAPESSDRLRTHGAAVFNGDRLVHSMRELVGDPLIETLPIQYTAVAVDLQRQREVRLR